MSGLGLLVGRLCHLPPSQRSEQLLTSHVVFRRFYSNGGTLCRFILFCAFVGSGVRVFSSAPPKLRISWSAPILLDSIPLISNSFTFWEDRANPSHLSYWCLSHCLHQRHGHAIASLHLHPFLLRLGRRRIAYPCMRVAHSYSSPSTIRYTAGASHLQVRQRHRLSYSTICRSARADRGLSVLAPRNHSTRPAHMNTPNSWTCDRRVLYSP